jgi:uncharacterized protein
MTIPGHGDTVSTSSVVPRPALHVRSAWTWLGGVILGLALLPAAAVAQDQPESVVTVSSRASVETEADRAHVSLAVETEAQSAQEAAGANADLTTAVTAAVRAAGEGAEGLRVATSGYALTPRYTSEPGNQGQKIVGYAARNTLEVTVDEIDRVGALIDAGLAAGANRVSSLSFEAKDPEPARAEATREAIRRASAEAEVMATALGMALGPPLDVQGGAEIPYPMARPSFEMEAMQLRAAPTPIESGPLTISSNVTIRFRLDPLP